MDFISFSNLLRFEQGIKDVLIQKFGNIASIIGSTTLNTTSQDLKGAINENVASIGNLSSLTTTEKSNLVGAVNETKSRISDLNGSVNEMRSHPMEYAEIEIDSWGNGPPTAKLSFKDSVDGTQFYRPLTYTFYGSIVTGPPPYTPPPQSLAQYEQIQTGPNKIHEANTGYDRWIFGKITDVSGRSVVSGYYFLPSDES